MGEKIRDVRPIHLIGADLMVELNEGYTKNQGHVIHIQNDQFRYLLTESDFYKVASDIMRADVELHYIKTHLPKADIRLPEGKVKGASAVSEFSLIKDIAKHKVEYRILEVRNKLVTLLIQPADYKKFCKCAKDCQAKRLEHPFGKRHGYKFLYQMKEFAIYEKDGYYYEIMCQLPCKSMTPKMWMPLDKCVQKSLWENKRVIDGYDYVSQEELWIYRMTKCIFMKIKFEKDDISFFGQNMDIVKQETLLHKMEMIVFGYAGRLLKNVEEGQFDRIITEYFSYTDY